MGGVVLMNTTNYALRLAEERDEAQLRKLLRETPMTGAISLTLEREPSFFGGDIDAARHDVVLHGDIGCGSRILRSAWWHGRPANVAYVSDLRIHPDHQRRQGGMLRQGFRFLDELATQCPAAVTWTVIFEANDRARRVLEGGRAGLPRYHDRGRLLCPSLLTRRGQDLPAAKDEDWPEITAFLNDTLRERPLAPRHTEADFREGKRWPGLRASDFLLLRHEGELLGLVAVYDARPFRQVRVRRLPAWMR